MVDVTSDFHAAARATVRKPRVKIDMVWTDPTIDRSIQVSSTDNNRGSILNQVADGSSETTHKWAHLGGNMILDGTYHPMPAPDQPGQVGWYSDTRCDASGVFATPPTLTVEFDARTVLALAVTGDTVYAEYPVDFTIEVYEGATLSHTEAVTGNTLQSWTEDISLLNLTAVTKMILSVTRWSAPLQLCKIVEFYTSVKATYSGDAVVTLNVLEERVLSDGTLPVGNISANEMDLELQNINIDGETDPLFPDNPDSTLAPFVRANRKIIPYIGFLLDDGVTEEFVKFGTFWSADWTVNEQSATVTVSARDRMEQLRKADFAGTPVFRDTDLFELAEYVLVSAKDDIPMPDIQWSIDTELKNYKIQWAWLPKSDYFTVIKTITEACMGQAYMSKDDVLIIEGPTELTTGV